ncbi:MAG: uracil-DNA glycosylase [Elusimicrobia bacterium]|nr:uracil-DNA glycosylase [Elusimicrobiota bacterium]
MVRKEVLNCRKCALGSQRLNACFGDGNEKTGIMFIGEGPGFEEDHRGHVFVGRAGKLLDKIISTTLGLERKDVFITNIVKCHPMKDPSNPEKRMNDRPPSEDEIAQCIPYLRRQIELICPRVIVALGSPSAKTLLGTTEGITRLRGRVFDLEFNGVKVKLVPTYHPAYLLRNPTKKSEVLEDTKIIRSLL